MNNVNCMIPVTVDASERSRIASVHMGVSKNRGTPKWMVYNGKPLLTWMILELP